MGRQPERDTSLPLLRGYEDASTWEKNLKLSVVFQLLDHTDILDIVMSSMESILPLQLGSARETIKEFTRELLTHEKRYSIHLSSLSLWCIQTARSCTHNSTDKGPSAATSGRPQLPLPIIRVDALCFTLLPKGFIAVTHASR
jgi:hypothetical protein